MAETTASWLPDKDRLARQYAEYLPECVALAERLETRLKSCVRVSSTPTYKSRVKSFNSYYRKLLRTLPENTRETTDLPTITDIIGIRIICAFLQDLVEVERCLKECFTVMEVERKGADRTFREFGYESTHILLAIPDDLREGLRLPAGLIFEVQIRTILQDAWAEVEHELVYKSEFSPFDLPLKRKLASINASLSLADIIFQEIRDYQNKLNRELDKRRGRFYDQVDLATDSRLPLEEGHPAGDLAEPPHPYVQGTIDDMILDAIEAHNRGDLSRAEQIYTRIIDAQPNDTILSVMYKHRGMAYFARSDYEKALADFRSSAERNPKAFRSHYYVAIVLGVMGNDEESLEAFSRSLELNPYQPFVYMRRAQARYRLGMYTEAIADLDKAVSLGYDKDEERRLRLLIAKKLDSV